MKRRKREYTPGPWSAEAYISPFASHYEIRSDKNRLWVASTSMCCERSEYPNAMLLAAAPEMAEFLDDLHHATDKQGFLDRNVTRLSAILWKAGLLEGGAEE